MAASAARVADRLAVGADLRQAAAAAQSSASAARRRRKRSPAGTSTCARTGSGLPAGKGTVKEGEALYIERCAACHGEFGESAGRWPILAGGNGTLASHDPGQDRSAPTGPTLDTVIDYIRRAMPFGDAQSLTNDELYAVTAYVLYLNDVVKDEDFVLSDKNLRRMKMPNERRLLRRRPGDGGEGLLEQATRA